MRTTRGSLRWGVLGLLAAAGIGPAALAYSLTGADWTWQSSPMSDPVYVNVASFPVATGTTTEIQDALEGAMDVINDEGGAAFSFTTGGTTTSTSWTFGDDNIMQWNTSTASSGTLAVAQYWSSGGSIANCDIRFYGSASGTAITWSADPLGAASGAYDLEHVAIHELNHCLGLGHSTDTDAIMYPSTTSGKGPADRHLDQDDIDGIQAIYGLAAGDLASTSSSVDDTSGGDGDGILELSESFTLDVTVENTGTADSTDVVGTLSVSSSDLSITDDTIDFGDIAQSASVDSSSVADDFGVTISSTCTADFTAAFTLDLDDAEGNAFSETLSLDIVCLPDEDGDGYTTATDCDDDDASVNPGATEVWYDGDDQDCSGGSDYDADGDGYDSDAHSGTDCDDADDAVHPAATEVCDEADNDCNGDTDDDDTGLDTSTASTWYDDSDGDGYGDAAASTVSCDQPSGTVADATDCDDSDINEYPGADEYCDGDDDNCDGDIDEDTAVDAATWYEDSDGDGYGNVGSSTKACSQPSDHVADNTDCNDTTSAANPGETEVCDNIDNDCDGTKDESDASDASTWYADTDEDGYGDAGNTTPGCTQPEGFITDDTDCDDSDGDTYPGADEYCDGHDDDCDEAVDEDDAVDAATWYADSDGDGYGDVSVTTEACSQPSEFVADTTDCDDGDGNTYPGATEYCDGHDDDCDDAVDEDDAADAPTWYQDADGDGFGDDDVTVVSCVVPAAHVAQGGDCDDGRADVAPGLDEVCDETDNDCDEEVDEDAVDAQTWYLDADGDGAPGETSVVACVQPEGSGTAAEDCDDGEAEVFPGGLEWCDGLDNDCNGAVDDADGCSEDGAAGTGGETEAAGCGCQGVPAGPAAPLAVVLFGVVGLARRRA